MVITTLRIITAPQSRAGVVRTLVARLGATRAQPGCPRCDPSQDLGGERRRTEGVTRSWQMAG